MMAPIRHLSSCLWLCVDIRLNLALLRRAVEQKDASLYSRVLRQTVVIRRQLRYESLVSITKPFAHGLETDPLQYVKPVLVCSFRSLSAASVCAPP